MKEMDEEQSLSEVTGKWAVIAMLCLSPLYILFIYLGQPGKGRAAWICSGVILISIKMRWELRKHVWFWITITILCLLHIPLVFLVPWTDKSMPGISLLPIAALDFGIIYGCIKLIEKAMKRSGNSSSTN